jgi:hypothetical protein
VAESASRRRLWVGPLLAVAGFLSYFTVLYRWPALRDVPWANLAILAIALLLSARALPAGWSRGALSRIGAVAGLAVSAGLAALFVWYCFVFSYSLPGEERALAVGAPVPSVVLADHRGAPFDLGRASREQTVLVVFYRGHW